MMNEDMMANSRIRNHTVMITAREKAMITGVNDVDSFNENEVILLSEAGVITVVGEDLHINKLNLEDGQLMIEGLIHAIEYSDMEPRNRGSFLGRLFKS